MPTCNDDTDDAPTDSWADVIEDFEDLAETFREEADINREKQDRAPEATEGELEGLLTPPGREYDPDVYLLIPHQSGDQTRPVPRRPDGPPPRLSAAMTVRHADTGQQMPAQSGGVPDTDYEIESTVRNVGGAADAATFELFVEHRTPNAALDTASDGVFEGTRGRSTISGFCTLESGPDRLYVLGYVDELEPENVIFRSRPEGGTGAVGGDIRPDRTFEFEETLRPEQPVRELLTSRSALNSDTFTIRVYWNRNGVIDATGTHYASPTEVAIDPTATYLRTDGDDSAGDASPIDLSALGITPGDTVKLTRQGRYIKRGTGGRGMIGVFSRSDRLRSAGRLNRVVDAVDAGPDVRTVPTFSEGKTTDIPEDFRISKRDGTDPSVTVDVPQGANYLFVSPFDNFFEDNSVPADGEFTLRITSRKREREALSNTIDTLENQTTLLEEVDGRFPEDGSPSNRKGQLNLASDITDSTLVEQRKIEVPATGETTVTTGYTTPSNTRQPVTSLTVFYARVYSLGASDDPADWDRLDHTTSRFVGRTEFTWD